MFYSADGIFFYKNKIYENFEPTQEDLLKINEYKENIKYSSLDIDVKKNIDNLIDFVVQEANNTVKEYSALVTDQTLEPLERSIKKRQVHEDLKNRKNTNNIIHVLERMTLYNGGKEFLDGLYRNQLSLFNNIVQIDGWKEAGITGLEASKLNLTCDSLKNKLSIHFYNYNKEKKQKNKANANIIEIEKQKIAAQEKKNLIINNINKTVIKYNETLINLHKNMCK